MKWKSVALAVLLAGSLGVHPLAVARAEDGVAEEARIGSEKLWDYAMCGVSLVFASGTGAWIVAVITCGRAVTLHWAH